MKPRSSEPILLPSDDESADIIETSNNTANTTTSELDHDESSDNSTAIEDIKTFIENDKEQPDVEPKGSSISQIVRFDCEGENLEVNAFPGRIRSTSGRINGRYSCSVNQSTSERTFDCNTERYHARRNSSIP